ncbi:DUF5615 family PIN-like protein [Chroococcus sp. FPU101]|uniref:DUF5615 family PIN-like protein n=1 Tax=Chroococcus sp. FPU101 TaxID=1974212 RepID=UPI001A8E766A|nr:DUF5615 family PIN-like protein [Chroococcus sp. FPU101]GFE72200.1 hypothetical protein CFPU101_48100 [Chroococcus sp. FPU101]
MAVALYMDVHVPFAITEQLRRRGVDVLTAIEDGSATLDDDVLLERVSCLGRVIFTQDIRFRALAEDWQRQGKPFAGLIFGHQLGGTIGQFVRDLELIAQASEPNEWLNTVEYLPF